MNAVVLDVVYFSRKEIVVVLFCWFRVWFVALLFLLCLQIQPEEAEESETEDTVEDDGVEEAGGDA